jgi:hypothetical protein
VPDVPRPQRRPKLRQIRGGRDRRRRWHGVDIVAAPAENPPFPIDARVAEEDTYLVLSAAPEVHEPAEPMVRLMTAVHDAVPEPAGSVVVRSGRPLRFLAVVHDLGADPTWREEWVGAAYLEIFRLAASRRLRALAVPLLATRHGRMPPERSLALLGQALARRPPGALERLWLVTGGAAEGALLDALDEAED